MRARLAPAPHAARSFKPATLDNGVQVAVPPFVEVRDGYSLVVFRIEFTQVGDKVVVNVADCTYVERAK